MDGTSKNNMPFRTNGALWVMAPPEPDPGSWHRFLVCSGYQPKPSLGLQSYLRFEGVWGGFRGSSHTEPEEVRLEP